MNNKEFYNSYFAQKATALQTAATAGKINVQRYLDNIKKEQYVKSVEKRLIWDLMYWNNFTIDFTPKKQLLDVLFFDDEINDNKLYTIMKKAFYAVFPKTSLNWN